MTKAPCYRSRESGRGVRSGGPRESGTNPWPGVPVGGGGTWGGAPRGFLPLPGREEVPGLPVRTLPEQDPGQGAGEGHPAGGLEEGGGLCRCRDLEEGEGQTLAVGIDGPESEAPAGLGPAGRGTGPAQHLEEDALALHLPGELGTGGADGEGPLGPGEIRQDGGEIGFGQEGIDPLARIPGPGRKGQGAERAVLESGAQVGARPGLREENAGLGPRIRGDQMPGQVVQERGGQAMPPQGGLGEHAAEAVRVPGGCAEAAVHAVGLAGSQGPAFVRAEDPGDHGSPGPGVVPQAQDEGLVGLEGQRAAPGRPGGAVPLALHRLRGLDQSHRGVPAQGSGETA